MKEGSQSRISPVLSEQGSFAGLTANQNVSREADGHSLVTETDPGQIAPEAAEFCRLVARILRRNTAGDARGLPRRRASGRQEPIESAREYEGPHR
jgi:hypothetical protein